MYIDTYTCMYVCKYTYLHSDVCVIFDPWLHILLFTLYYLFCTFELCASTYQEYTKSRWTPHLAKAEAKSGAH